MTRKFCILFVLLISLVSLEKARARSIILEWNASISSDVAGYNVYYGTSSGNYSYKINVGNVTSLTVSNLACGVTYYFAATAYDANGNESAYSSEVTFVPPGILTVTPCTETSSSATLHFPVEPGHWYEVQATTDLQNWSTIWQTDVAATNVWTQYTDPNAGSFRSRFYRLVLH